MTAQMHIRLRSTSTLEDAMSVCADLKKQAPKYGDESSEEDDDNSEEDEDDDKSEEREDLIQNWEFCLDFVQFGRKWGADAEFARMWSAAVVALSRSVDVEVGLDALEKFAKVAGAGKVFSEFLDLHRASEITIKAICSSIARLTGEYDMDWQEAIGRGQGCNIVVSLMRQYMENPDVLRDVVLSVATLVCDEDGLTIQKNNIRFRKAGACELLVAILRKYLKSNESVRNVAAQAIAGVCANNPFNKVLFGKLGACPLIVEAARDGCEETGHAIANLASEHQAELLKLGALKALKNIQGWGVPTARNNLKKKMRMLQGEPSDDEADGVTSEDDDKGDGVSKDDDDDEPRGLSSADDEADGTTSDDDE